MHTALYTGATCIEQNNCISGAMIRKMWYTHTHPPSLELALDPKLFNLGSLISKTSHIGMHNCGNFRQLTHLMTIIWSVWDKFHGM